MDFTETYDDTCSSVGFAARTGAIKTLKALLKSGRSVDVKDNRGWRPTHEAAHAGHTQCLELLLNSKFTDVNWRNFEGLTALFFAVKQQHVDCVSLLLRHGADPNLSSELEGNPLDIAAAANDVKIAKMLVDHGADVNAQNHYLKYTALHSAVNSKSADVVEFLLAQGSQLSLSDENQMTAFVHAALKGDIKCLTLLLEEAKKQGLPHLVDVGAYDHATPLFLAAQEGYVDCVELLLKHGADPNIPTVTADGVKDALPIHAAVEQEHERIIDLLGPVTSKEAERECSVRLMGLALECMSYGLLKKLVNFDFDVNVMVNSAEFSEFEHFDDYICPGFEHLFWDKLSTLVLLSTKTHHSIVADIEEIVELLISRGVPIDAQDCFERSPLVQLVTTCAGDNLKVMECLMKHRVNPNITHPYIQGNLAVRASLTNMAGLECLLKYGADIQLNWTEFSQNQHPCQHFWAFVCLRLRYCVREANFCLIKILLMFMDIYPVDGTFLMLKDIVEESDWSTLVAMTDTPKTLQHLSRMQIRRQLGYGRITSERVGQLLLPELLKDYILLGDVKWEL
ncbi:ankyrin repeat and KH domain-containing protein mask [Lingula anatina]|uniref:Ankyrin repeat and KH domain-containing protein mask n=1 Tax=Lingula anatina TaxID=7574 RepID=A0A1S3H6T6_LINAN|nr:ankyrin repeat and KH domain-containing protein mask [Lingula anatina]|eukprot:XP_013380839.1 ankyrin repeat and KH domain-containing protein mask [Lingula anatina]